MYRLDCKVNNQFIVLFKDNEPISKFDRRKWGIGLISHYVKKQYCLEYIEVIR